MFVPCAAVPRFLVQDIAKVATYWLMAKLNVGQQHEVDVRLVSGKIRAAIDTENRNDRIRGRGKQNALPPSRTAC